MEHEEGCFGCGEFSCDGHCDYGVASPDKTPYEYACDRWLACLLKPAVPGDKSKVSLKLLLDQEYRLRAVARGVVRG